MAKCPKTIKKLDWVKVNDIKNRHFNTEGMVLSKNKNSYSVELEVGPGDTIFRTFKKKQLKKIC